MSEATVTFSLWWIFAAVLALIAGFFFMVAGAATETDDANGLWPSIVLGVLALISALGMAGWT